MTDLVGIKAGFSAVKLSKGCNKVPRSGSREGGAATLLINHEEWDLKCSHLSPGS